MFSHPSTSLTDNQKAFLVLHRISLCWIGERSCTSKPFLGIASGELSEVVRCVLLHFRTEEVGKDCNKVAP